jgi:hypothetical protein
MQPTLRSAAVLLLGILLLASGSCDFIKSKLGQTWGSKITIDGLAGYTLGAAESAIEKDKFPFISAGKYRAENASLSISGTEFKGNMEITINNGKISEIRFTCENISSGELKALRSAALNEIRSTYSNSIIKSKSNTYNFNLVDANSKCLALATFDATIADNDASFFYAAADHEISR